MNPQDYKFLTEFLKKSSGLVLNSDKQYLLESRLTPIIRKAGLESISDVVSKLKDPTQKRIHEAVIEAMTTNESFFFRDKTPFDNFNDIMIPEILESRKLSRKARIWCAAAAGGQEPYSLAICLKEMAAKTAGWRFEILGTDLSAEILDKAKAGVYSQFEVQRGMPIQMLVNYFAQQGEMWQVKPDLRSMIRWQQFNLLDSFLHFGKFDVVFCRNVLIYFDVETKKDILERIASAMNPDSYLVLGAAETVVGITNRFKPVDGVRSLYRVQPAESGATHTTAGHDRLTPLRAVNG